MTILSVILLVFFILVAVLLVLLVLVQNEEGDSLGGIFAGGSASAFGSRSGNVLTKATSILGALFLALSFGLALVNRSPSDAGVEAAAQQLSPTVNRNWWQENETATPAEPSAAESPISESSGLEVPLAEPPELENADATTSE
jgi:preprotein translocase subunit SecG